ncbi:MAG: PD-(D/E)XK nuclease family protein [Planctomycetota bacterium]
MKRVRKLSTSALTAFLECPERYRLAYVEGIRPAEDAAVLRVGSSWHGIREAISDADDQHDRLDAAMAYLDERYGVVPNHISPEAWAVERESLAVAAVAYDWHYRDDDQIEHIAAELPYELPLHDPATGQPVMNGDVRNGVIDNLVRLADGRVAVREYKTTSRDIDPAADYWKRLKWDQQISTYLVSAQQMQRQGLLLPYGIRPSDPLIDTVVYDVMRKPTIRPKYLTQAETKRFRGSGEYCGRVCDLDPEAGTIDGYAYEVKAGKGGEAIKETPTMYGARLLEAICADPRKYFARREIARTAGQLRDYQVTLWKAYQTIVYMDENDLWVRNMNSCETPFKCQYTAICYYDQPTTNGQTPQGFKRIFSVTVNGAEVAA